MSDDTGHLERIGDGFLLLIGMAISVAVLLAIKEAVVRVVIPHMRLFGSIIAFIVLVLSIAYLFGYMMNDVPKHIREWTE